MDPKNFASLALDLIATVRGGYDDQSLAAVSATRAFLRDIATGKLIVGTPAEDQPDTANVKPIRKSTPIRDPDIAI